MKLLTTIGLLSWIVFIVSADTDPDQGPSFFEIMQGEWDVQRSVMYMSDGMQQISEPTYYHYSIAQDNETDEMALIGRYFQKDPDTGDFTDDVEINIDFSTPGTGVFKTQSKYEFAIKPLFKFDFRMFPNGVQLSHGDWQGELSAFYQFQIPDYNTFTITLYPKNSPDGDSNPPATDADVDDEEFISSHTRPQETASRCTKEGGCDDEIEVILYLGKKQVVPAEKSIVQKYGWVIIGGMIILNIYFQKKQRQPATAPPSTSQKSQKSQGGSKKSK